MAAEEFKDQDLKGSRFEHVDLSETNFHNLLLRRARFEHVDLSEARFHNLLMSDVRITGAWAQNLEIEAEVEGSLSSTASTCCPYIEEVLNARYPGRETVFAVREGDADAFRAAWAVDQEAWAETVERARRLPEEKLHERVDGEWSFIQTLRHLVFATDSWIRRAMLGDPWPYDALDLPFTEMDEIEGDAQRHRGPPVARRGAGPARRPHGDRQRGDRGPHRRAARRHRPSRSRSPATRRRSRTRSAAAWRRS